MLLIDGHTHSVACCCPAHTCVRGQIRNTTNQRFRHRYAAVGKTEWWWIFDDTLKEIARQLLTQDFVVLDHFVVPELAARIKAELIAMYGAGTMKRGLLAGGRTGKNTKYALGSIRGACVRACLLSVQASAKQTSQLCVWLAGCVGRPVPPTVACCWPSTF